MTNGKLEYAIRIASNMFDEWNDATGVFEKHTGYYYEALAVIEDAVKIGAIAEGAKGIECDYGDKVVNNN